jgi:hypothetical protein
MTLARPQLHNVENASTRLGFDWLCSPNLQGVPRHRNFLGSSSPDFATYGLDITWFIPLSFNLILRLRPATPGTMVAGYIRYGSTSAHATRRGVATIRARFDQQLLVLLPRDRDNLQAFSIAEPVAIRSFSELPDSRLKVCV